MLKKSKKKPAANTVEKPVALLVGTRKGAFILRSDKTRRSWTLSNPIFLGHIIYHFVSDPTEHRTLLMAAKTGHLGHTIYKSGDFGKSWKEVEQPRSSSERSRNRMGLPDGWNDCMAPYQPGWQTGGLHDPQRRKELETSG